MKSRCLILVALTLASSCISAERFPWEIFEDPLPYKLPSQPPVLKYEAFAEFNSSSYSEPCIFRTDVRTTFDHPRYLTYLQLTDSIIPGWDWIGPSYLFAAPLPISVEIRNLSKWPQFKPPLFPEIVDNQNWKWLLPMRPGYDYPRIRWEEIPWNTW